MSTHSSGATGRRAARGPRTVQSGRGVRAPTRSPAPTGVHAADPASAPSDDELEAESRRLRLRATVASGLLWLALWLAVWATFVWGR